MAVPSDISRSFRLYISHVDSEGHFLKISGQLDQQASLMIESLFDSARENLEKGIGAVPPAAIHEGVICAAKYKDGTYYRAKIINVTNLNTGLVGVHFIDYGNKDIISLSTIRFLDSYDPMFLQLRGQATDYYLSRIMHPSGRWEEPLLLKLQSLLCNSEYPCTIEAQTPTTPIISIQFKGNDLSSHLVTNRFGISIPIQKQEVLLMQLAGASPPSNWQSSFGNESPYTEHVPFLYNQNFPSNPASAMRLQQNVSLPFNGSVPPPSMISQRLLVNKVSRTPVTLKAPIRQPNLPQIDQPPPSVLTSSSPPVSNKPAFPKKSITYKSRLLEVNTQHKVFVSFAEEGPELFAVQLVADGKKLQDMMDDINRRPHSSLAEPPMIGTVCLGRMSGDRIICRAIVMNLSGGECKLFFVDFGDTEMVSYYDIFDIPEEFVKPNVFAMRFCLSGVKKLEKGPHLNEIFKQIVDGKVLTLRVVPPEGPPLIQYGELYIDGQNVLDLLLATMKDKLQFKWMEMLPFGSRKSVLVSYVDCCIKFFVQLSDKIDELNNVMEAVRVHCESSSSPGPLPVGTACCAKFPDDGKWYRTRVREVKGNKVVVDYVDYGNEQEIDVSDLRTITPELLKLPAQAMKCALKGYENKPVESKTSNQLEMLALEKTLMAHVVGVVSNDTMLVSLVDDTVTPPFDVARRMAQLSAPRSNNEQPARSPQTPVRKDAPESFSSPEGSEKKGFRREKSFKDERPFKDDKPFERKPRENDDFGQRPGSFRNRDKDSFDRSAPGRHSEKFGGRPDKGERRGGKPWENNGPSAVPLPADDDWEESPATTSPPAFQPRQNRDNARRKQRPDDKGQKPNWKSRDAAGVGKRLRQAAEAAAEQSHSKTSIQDRLKRDRFNSNQQDEWEDKKEGWGNKGGRDNRDSRPDRRDNRGDRRDNWGDKKENFQKREFRDNNRENNRERGDRPRSNFTPRDRAERSFSSDCDKKSDKSFKSQDSGGRAGRAPPYKTRSKFTQVQYKELPNPVPLDTPYETPVIEPNAQHEVAVTWITSPDSFYTQILSQQSKFLDMMHSIPELYKGVKSYTGIVPIGASVLARFPIDGVLYRATVISVQPGSKFIVQYVDFGNKQLVDAKDIWQLDKQLLELPITAVHCCLMGVTPQGGEWKSSEVDLCFNAPRYQCVYQDCNESGQWNVSLWINGVSVADMLVEKQLASLSEHQSSVALKDEPIDLSIIVGQQILCKVTHVDSFDKFYIQLDLDKAALVEAAIESYDTSKLTPLAAESCTNGTHTTVKHEGKIYRAILSDVTNVENIQAVLPDYGMTITTSLANLMILPTELSVYYYQSLPCSLNNYTSESNTLMSVDELKQKLTGNKFIIYINRVEEITLITTLYNVATGQKVALFEPDEGAYEEVVPLCERAIFNYNFGNAYISHAENLNKLYLQKATDSDRLAGLLDELYKFCEEGTPEALESFDVDGLCIAQSSDSNWYRAIILEANDNDVKLQFCDYGNSETVAKGSVKKLDPKFHEPCALAFPVSLGLVALTPDATDKLVEWTTDKEVQVTLTIGTDGWLATLHLDGVDLSMKLVNEKLATPQLSAEVEVEIEQPAPEPLSLPEGCTHAKVYISHIDTPGHFWLQMLDKVDKIEEIQAELQTNADSYPEIENREMGTICVAKYLADDQWYRAEILDSDSDITTVRFIDYGNTDVLDNQPGLIKVIPDHLKEIERYALKSSVNAVPTGTGEWSEPASECFTQLVGDLSEPVDAVIVLKDVTMYVDIFVNNQNTTDKLVSEGYATRSEENECGDLPSCFASHINSPSEFWIQLETATPELQAMEAAMVDAENFPELTEKEEGVICAAKYPEDGAWYRAQVIVDGSEGTEVLFMDYGNASIANELRSLSDELKIKPALSRKCALQKPRDIKSWSRKSELKFNELAAEGATIFNVQFIASGDISIVELYLEGKSVTEELVGLCEEHTSTERPTPVGQGKQVTGRVCYVNSLEEFYCQLDSNTAELDKIFEQITNAADFESVGEIKVGSVLAAFWDEDEQWYRAKILELCEGGYHVHFIDYGNKAKCSEFRQLPEELSHIEPLAKCCKLSGSGENTAHDDAVKEKLDELAADESSIFEIDFLDSNIEPSLVKLIINGKDIRSLVSSSETIEASSKDVSSSETIKASSKEPPLVEESAPVVVEEPTSAVVEQTTPAVVEQTTPAVVEQTTPAVVEKTTPAVVEKTTQAVVEKTTPAVIEEKAPAIEEPAAISEELATQEIVESEIEKADPEEISNADLNEPSPTETEDVLQTEETTQDATESELNTSQPDLNESVESSNTVIENKSFESAVESFEDDTETPVTPNKDDTSTETLENSKDTIVTDRDDSKESLNTDTGYTSDHDNKDNESKDMLPSKVEQSPEKEIIKESELPSKEEVKPVAESKDVIEPNNETKVPEMNVEPSKEPDHPDGDAKIDSKDKEVK